jgi:hypothetical protein
MAEATGSGSSFADAFRAALTAVAHAPRASYTARSARAQYRHLMNTRAGRAALGQAGLAAAAQTQRRWLAGRQKPGRANRAIITAAYQAMQQGGIPRSVKSGAMSIRGRVGTGTDIRNRGTGSNAELRIDLSHGQWDRIEPLWDDDLTDDEDLEDMISEDLIEPDIGGSDNWYFPGSGYTVTLTY